MREPDDTSSDDASPDTLPDGLPKRKRRGARFWIGALTLGLIVLWLLWRGALWGRIAQEVAGVRAAGHPASVEELNRWVGQPPDAHDNEAYVLTDAYDRFDSHRWRLLDERSLFDGGYGATFSIDTERLAEPWSAGTLDDCAACVRDNADTLRLLREAAAKPDCRFLTRLPHGTRLGMEPMGKVRVLVRLLGVEARYAAEDGDAARAAEALRTAWSVALLIGGDPRPESTMFAQSAKVDVAAAAMRVLSRVQLTDEQLASLLDVTAEPSSVDELRDAAIRDRALWLDGAWGGFEFFRTEFANGAAGELQWLTYRAAGLRDVDRMTYLQYMADVIDEMARPGPDLHTRIERRDEAVANLQPVCGLTVQNIWGSLVLEHQRSAAMLHAFRVALAVERYRLAEGQLPSDAATLAPRFIDALPGDPFTGGPVQYAKLETGYVVYSFGADGDDATYFLRVIGGISHPPVSDDDIRFEIRR